MVRTRRADCHVPFCHRGHVPVEAREPGLVRTEGAEHPHETLARLCAVAALDDDAGERKSPSRENPASDGVRTDREGEDDRLGERVPQAQILVPPDHRGIDS